MTENFESVPNQSRPSSMYETSLKDGVPKGNAAPIPTTLRKLYSTIRNHNGILLEIARFAQCSQRQTRTNWDNSRQASVPKRSRLLVADRESFKALEPIALNRILSQFISTAIDFNLNGRRGAHGKEIHRLS